MTLKALIELATSQGFVVKEKAGDAGHFIASKSGFADSEFFEFGGHAHIFWAGLNPVGLAGILYKSALSTGNVTDNHHRAIQPET